MILLDAVVVAEALRPEPKPGVIRWLDAQLIETLYLAATSVAALQRDAARQPLSKRQSRFWGVVTEQVIELFESRILPFDLPAMKAHNEIMAHVVKYKYSIGRRDALTAAVAKAYGCKVACCNESPFLAAGLTVINPWYF